MKVLILGGSGMLGHKLYQVFNKQFSVNVTLRSGLGSYEKVDVFDPTHVIARVSAEDFDSIVRAVAVARPDVLVNCIGVIKQVAAAKDPLVTITLNALLPHRLAMLCRGADVRLIHVSTDCVFSGRRGRYSESDVADAKDLYGRTKFLGEVSDDSCLTLRTSIIGRELLFSRGLIEWFLSQEGKEVLGYKRAIFSGFTTFAVAQLIAEIIAKHKHLRGIWHLASEPINKYDLLTLVKHTYGLKIQIRPDETVVCDRSLDATRFREATGFVPPSWPDMVNELYSDPTPYSEIRRKFDALR